MVKQTGDFWYGFGYNRLTFRFGIIALIAQFPTSHSKSCRFLF